MEIVTYGYLLMHKGISLHWRIADAVGILYGKRSELLAQFEPCKLLMVGKRTLTQDFSGATIIIRTVL
jgi:hypothetical protein